MLIVTGRAASELKAVLEANATDPKQALRLAAEDEGFSLALGFKEEGDEAVESEGTDLLLVPSDLALELTELDLVIDCIDTDDGPCLTVYKAHECDVDEAHSECDCGCSCHEHEEQPGPS